MNSARRLAGWAAFGVGLALAALSLVFLMADTIDGFPRWAIGAIGMLLIFGGWEAAHGRRV